MIMQYIKGSLNEMFTFWVRTAF